MAQVKYTAPGTLTAKVTTELNSLADDTAALNSVDISNDADAERDLLANFHVTIATQGSARNTGSSNLVSLLIVPGGLSDDVYTDVAAALNLALNYIAKREDGSDVSWILDDAVTDRDLTAYGVRIPNGDFRVGLLNRSSQALAASGNIVYMGDVYSTQMA